MVFSSTSFLYVFLPLFLLCYVVLPWRNGVILVFSLLFFAWGEGAYLLLLLLTIGFNYFIGGKLDRAPEASRWLALGVALNLLVLGYFKYFGFLVSTVLQLPIPQENIPHLPLGISFFIFQSMSYLFDVYRKESPKALSYFDLALYIAMFPQLIAGPIVRYNTVAQAIRVRFVDAEDVYRGIVLFIVGLAYKMLLANNAAEVADAVFALSADRLDTPTAWLGAGAYTLQIFFDFAGYSLMAIGLGRIMGFHFPQNFNYPYISQSITEFWRRWHMSLSSWFRDYLYIPLGGNRRGPWRTYFNLFIVFFLCGLWHGAAWTFIVWGMFHGLILALERMALGQWLSRIPRPFRHVYTLLLVIIGWVLFRAETLPQAGYFLQAMFSATGVTGPDLAELASNENLAFAVLGIVFSLPVLERSFSFYTGEAALPGKPSAAIISRDLLVATALLLVCSAYVMSGTYNPFIYFRF